MKLKEIPQNTVVHTPTEDAAHELLAILYENGWKTVACTDGVVENARGIQIESETDWSWWKKIENARKENVTILTLAEFKRLYCEPEKPQPKVKVGDIVRIINDCGCNAYGLVGVIESVDPKSVDVTCDDIKLSCLYEWIEPYTEPETKPTEDMDTKEKESGEKGNNPQNSQLDLCELLKGRCTTFYSPMWGDTDVLQLYDVNLRIAPCKNHDSWLNTDEQGKCDDDGICMLWPSRALYEQYPLDAYTALMKWREK